MTNLDFDQTQVIPMEGLRGNVAPVRYVALYDSEFVQGANPNKGGTIPVTNLKLVDDSLVMTLHEWEKFIIKHKYKMYKFTFCVARTHRTVVIESD